MAQLALACKATSRGAKAGIANLFGMAGDQNSSGDDQKKLDVLSNDIFVTALLKSGSCCVLVSEEDEDPIIVPEAQAGGSASRSTLDGSSNIDCNVSTGTIFAVYEKKTPGKVGSVEDVLAARTSPPRATAFPAGGGKKIYCNEANSIYWDKPIKEACDDFKKSGYSQRYVGSMVSDRAGGVASTGMFNGSVQRMLDLVPTSIQRAR
ncbi:fructose 1,6-bisphosphate 1-phosphatase [Aureococcus anophagefferens]|nr:fructose 1,6-bisphosphate 1-phosphatase [Aureococcus anophagefferens]